MKYRYNVWIFFYNCWPIQCFQITLIFWWNFSLNNKKPHRFMKFKKANYLPIFFKKKSEWMYMYETRDDKIMSGFLTKSKLKTSWFSHGDWQGWTWNLNKLSKLLQWGNKVLIKNNFTNMIEGYWWNILLESMLINQLWLDFSWFNGVNMYLLSILYAVPD